MESTSSGGARTPGTAAREHWTDGSRRWRGASRGVVEKRRPGEAAAAEADIFGLLVRVVIAVSSCFSYLIFLINNKSAFLRAIFSGRAACRHAATCCKTVKQWYFAALHTTTDSERVIPTRTADRWQLRVKTQSFATIYD
jgi:hypothetical protein